MILSVSEIRAAEAFTMANEPISSVDLMERAGTVFTENLLQYNGLSTENQYVVLCGSGNNGGDGLVIARLLAETGHIVTVCLCYGSGKISYENQINRTRLSEFTLEKLSIIKVKSEKELDSILLTPSTIVIDALFGIGLSKPLTGYYANIVMKVNSWLLPIFAVDTPSGLFADQHTSKQHPCIQAFKTYTFQYMKQAFLMPENEIRVGTAIVLDIGMDLPSDFVSDKILVNSTIISKIIQAISKFAHKGSNGHGLLIAGNRNMPGAALLAAKSALRSGIGKVTLHIPDSLATFVPFAIPEVILSRDKNNFCFSGIDLEHFPSINAIAIGPGIGKNPITSAALSNLIDELHSPMILDADALNILGDNKTWISFLPENSILTPHFKEFERLAGKSANDFERMDRLCKFAQQHQLVVILKGANSMIAMPDGKLFVNTTGNPGMATAGSGDVLTGILLALLARGYAPEMAAILGVYIHGLAGDIAIGQQQSTESLIASDIIENLGESWATSGNRTHEFQK
ncbi:MAG: NAD(P)H-hydrate dehydratase [Bacteroidales bacterium]|jgi:NAD(P)H-hydrate epimerase|nr:NAD(P)H-hydrate dehydratase [Bacteroidales bacterium]